MAPARWFCETLLRAFFCSVFSYGIRPRASRGSSRCRTRIQWPVLRVEFRLRRQGASPSHRRDLSSSLRRTELLRPGPFACTSPGAWLIRIPDRGREGEVRLALGASRDLHPRRVAPRRGTWLRGMRGASGCHRRAAIGSRARIPRFVSGVALVVFRVPKTWVDTETVGSGWSDFFPLVFCVRSPGVVHSPFQLPSKARARRWFVQSKKVAACTF